MKQDVGLVTTESNTEKDFWRLVIEPNCSLTWRQSMIFFIGISVFCLSIATVFALKGFWMIFPFAGLELLALGAGFYLAAHASSRRQVVSISGEQVTVEKGRLRSGPQRRWELPRSWARVQLEQVDDQRQTRRVWLGASGRRVELGEFLTDNEKDGLAHQLRSLLQNSENRSAQRSEDDKDTGKR